MALINGSEASTKDFVTKIYEIGCVLLGQRKDLGKFAGLITWQELDAHFQNQGVNASLEEIIAALQTIRMVYGTNLFSQAFLRFTAEHPNIDASALKEQFAQFMKKMSG